MHSPEGPESLHPLGGQNLTVLDRPFFFSSFDCAGAEGHGAESWRSKGEGGDVFSARGASCDCGGDRVSEVMWWSIEIGDSVRGNAGAWVTSHGSFEVAARVRRRDM